MNKSLTLTSQAPTQEQIDQLGKVGVLFGGISSEREVSLQSGKAVTSALEALGVQCVAIDIQDNAIDALRDSGINRAFIALHGAGGEDGKVQAILEALHIPYTGSRVQASALAMDKLLCKWIWKGMALSTPAFAVLDNSTDWSAALSKLGGKAMVKPVHEGSSIGMCRVETAAELEQAYRGAAQYDDCVIAERLIVGAEYTVAIVNGTALPPIALETDHTFYDYDAKYIANDTRYLCPCGLSDEKTVELQALAVEAFASIGCRGWGRVDVMADAAGQFYLLEVNTVPGMTDHSLVPMAAQAEGLSFSQLVWNIIQEAT